MIYSTFYCKILQKKSKICEQKKTFLYSPQPSSATLRQNRTSSKFTKLQSILFFLALFEAKFVVSVLKIKICDNNKKENNKICVLNFSLKILFNKKVF